MLVSQNLLTNHADSPEARMALAGIKRFEARQDRLTKQGALAERDDYSSVVARSLLDVVDRLNATIEKDPRAQGGGKKSKIILKVKDIDVVTVAYLTISTIFSSLHKHYDKPKIATQIGHALEAEHRFGFISQQQPQLWERLTRYAKERGSYRHKVRFVENVAAKEEVLEPEWSLEDCTLIGAFLIKIVEEAGIVETRTITKGHISRSELVITELVSGWLEDRRKGASEGALPGITPIYEPMTEIPLDWSSSSRGGYARLQYKLVKSGKADYANADMSKVYRAVNLMQHTAWHMNPTMLGLVERLWSEGNAVGKLPTCLKQAASPRLSDEEWGALSVEEQKGRRIAARDVHDSNRQAASDLVSIDMVLEQGRRLRDEPEIFIPYQLDYRGRAYCVPLSNPQGPDYVRCLFEFAKGKPVGSRGAMWLGIQVASLWDGEYCGKRLGKSSFQARYEWAECNEEMLRSITTNPTTDRRWQQADKPFMFLRTAYDWVGFLDQGEDFVSHIPIALDGSCSGIQHYSAILRDPVGGARVNLLPSEEPADVYADVAEAVLPMVQADIGNTTPIENAKEGRDTTTSPLATADDAARFWLQHGITRKVVKTPTMTYGYSSREAGFTEKYENDYVRPALKALGVPVSSGPIARYLAKHTLTAVESLLPAVAEGMEWLVSCASLLAHEGKGIAWTAPSGFPVVQRYMNTPSIRVETMLGGEKLRVSVPGKPSSISKEKQKSAVSPNHTHSLDAAHLMLTVIRAFDEYEVSSFSVIHDSFGTHAADADAMFAAVREAFIEMYEENDPFQHLYEQVHGSLSEEGKAKLPLPPAKGTLDITAVGQSLYAFA